MDLLNLFDKIFIIHCLEDDDRLANIKFQISHLSDKKSKKIEIYETCRFPFSKQCAYALMFSNKSRFISNGSEFNLTREFYRIIKTSYLKGFKRILIFEDDFRLLKPNYMEPFLESFPKDFDIIQLSYLFNIQMYDFSKLTDLYYEDVHWVEKDFGAFSNNGLALSRKGMKYFIDFIDNEFVAADIPMHESKNNNKFWGHINKSDSDIKHYVPTIPLVYVDGVDSRVQTDDKKDLYENYKYIDKSAYLTHD